MSVNGISSGTLNIPQVNTANPPAQSVAVDRDGDNDGGGVAAASGTPARGGFVSAINQALSQIGVSGSAPSAATGTASAAQDPLQALSNFVHNLFAALQAQGAAQPGAAQGGDSDGDNDGSGASAAAGVARHQGGGNIASRLQSLIQQLSASSSSTSGSSTSGTTPTTDTSSSVLAALQQSFQNLLSSQGASGSQATLGSFLQTLAQDLPGASPAGNIVQTQA